MTSYPTLTSDTTVLSIAEALRQHSPDTPRHPLIWVEGEITNVSHARSGHTYFKLSNGSDLLPCVIWKGVAKSLPVRFQDGLAIVLYGWTQKSPKDGRIELDVRNLVVRDDQGPRQTAMQSLKEKLRAEGLLDEARKRPLPKQPAVVGVVTSPGGAVIHDITRILQRRAPGVRVALSPTRVSGEEAAEEIAAAIRSLAASGTASPIIVARGGGSSADLQPFNTEVVARAIAECPVPILSAIGHEPDVTLSDLVADVRCATPSEAAERAVPEISSETSPEDPLELQLVRGDVSLRVQLSTRTRPQQ